MSALAASTVVVTPTNTQGWSTADTRPGGTVTFSNDNTAPGNPHNGALQLTTDSTMAAKAQYMHAANTPLANVTELSYSTKQVSGPVLADASYQLPICALGFTAPVTASNPSGCNGFTTLVYEPYQHGVITPGNWQSWNVGNSTFWSSRTFTNGTCSFVGTQGPPTYTLASMNAMCPNAAVVGFGVNIGSNNLDYNVETDLVNFNGTTYNFEPYQTPTDKDQCKKNGWKNYGATFKNQGQCEKFVEQSQHDKNKNDNHQDGESNDG